MITENIFKDMDVNERIVGLLKDDWTKHSVKEHVNKWLDAMNRNEIEKTIFMATASLSKDFIEFINSNKRFIGFAKINPSLPKPTRSDSSKPRFLYFFAIEITNLKFALTNAFFKPLI